MLLAFTLLDLDRRSEAIEISRAALADFDAAGDQARVHEIQTLLEQLGAF
jgi:hypothetical protein